MGFPDMRTVLLTGVISFLVCTLLILLVWLNSRKRYRGMGYWVISFALQTAGMLLILQRGLLPDLVSVVLSNLMVMCGAMLGLIALERFLERPGAHWHNVALLTLFVLLHSWLTWGRPSLPIRNINHALTLLIISAQYLWLVLVRTEPGQRPQTRPIVFVFGGYCLVSLARIAVNLTGNAGNNDLFSSGMLDTFILIAYQILFFLLSYSLMTMVNTRLFMDLRVGEEKFSKAFHSSPYAITISRLSDGCIFEVNAGFEKITGYPASAVLGRTSLELGLWQRDEDRATLVAALTSGRSVRGLEFSFRSASGAELIGLLSAEVIDINGEPALVASIDDITGRKQNEASIQRLLAEKDLILKEVHHRIKNNMSSVMALLQIQSGSQTIPAAASALETAANRLQSMMVLYDRLYRSDNATAVSMRDYFSTLIDEILACYADRQQVRLATSFDDMPLDSRLLSHLGIILNELITNSLKYAFTDTADATITVAATVVANRLTMTYADNGRGLSGTDTTLADSLEPPIATARAGTGTSAVAATDSRTKSQGFGMQLISLLVEQLAGSLDIAHDARTGMNVVITLQLAASPPGSVRPPGTAH
jgi:PAS domain S-box-containing protein